MSETIISDPLTPPLEALYWTQYSRWYQIFRKHAPKSTIIDIDTVQPELLGWLESDTFVLPEGSGPSTSTSRDRRSSSSSWGSSSHSIDASGLTANDVEQQQNETDNDDEDDEEEQTTWKLPNLDQKIIEVVEKYEGGPIYPKLNWSAPQDAAFMLPGNNCQCLLPEDVYLLLKSSEFVGRDLEQVAAVATTTSSPSSGFADEGMGLEVPKGVKSMGDSVTSDFDNTASSSAVAANETTSSPEQYQIRPQLVLKKWFPLTKSHEYRCFIRSHRLIAITQRDVTFYDHLQDPHFQSRIRSAIYTFWETVVESKRESGEWSLGDYVMDVYLTKDLGRCWVIDFNGWLPRTDPLLFSFDDLEELHLREKSCRPKDGSKKDTEVTDLGDGIVRLRLNPSTNSNTNEGDAEDATISSQDDESEDEGWGESDVELRVLSDRRMQSSGGTGATYSSNMAPKDLVDFAKTNGGGGVEVDDVVKRWNAQVDAEENS